jgi:hypothetical protein
MENIITNLEKIYGFYSDVKTHGFSIVYKGEINQTITKAFTSLAEDSLDRISEEPFIKKKVFHVMVECLQNLYKHSDDTIKADEKFSANGIFIIGRTEDTYYVITGNTVGNYKKEYLTKLIDHINSLDKDELKHLYIQQMKEGALSDKGGAGLGFIDIARKTGQKFEYHFENLTDDNFFFVLKSTIARVKS